MISRISLLKGKEGVSEKDFRNALVEGFEAIVGEMPTLFKCEINVVTDRQQRSWAGRGSVDIDGFVEMYFESYGDMNEALEAKGEAIAELYAKVAEAPVSEFVSVKKVDTPVPAYLQKKGPIKRVSFCDRKEGVDAMKFHTEWWYTHSLLVKHMTGYCGYNQNLVVDRLVDGKHVGYEELPFEGMVEFFFEDMDAFDECYGTPGFERRASPHAAEFIGTVTTYFVDPIVVK